MYNSIGLFHHKTNRAPSSVFFPNSPFLLCYSTADQFRDYEGIQRSLQQPWDPFSFREKVQCASLHFMARRNDE